MDRTDAEVLKLMQFQTEALTAMQDMNERMVCAAVALAGGCTDATKALNDDPASTLDRRKQIRQDRLDLVAKAVEWAKANEHGSLNIIAHALFGDNLVELSTYLESGGPLPPAALDTQAKVIWVQQQRLF